MTAAEVVAKLSVQGDGQAINAMTRFSRAVDNAGSASQRTVKAMVGAATGMNAFYALLAGGAVIGGVFAFGRAAVQASNDVEALKRSLEALTGSAAAAEAKWDFIRRLAIPSKSTAMELGQIGLQIEGMGMRLEKVLPLITKWTMGTGIVTQERMSMAMRVFTYLSQGRTPEVEAMTGLGINQGQLAAAGAAFSKQGQLISGPAESLDALARVIESKYGRIFQTMGATGAARLSAFADMWQQFMAKAGDAIKVFLLPFVDRLSVAIGALTSSGTVERLAAQFTRLFGGFGIGGRAGLADAVVAMVHGMERGMAIMAVFAQRARSVFLYLWDNARIITSVMVGIWAVGPITAFLRVLTQVRAVMAGTAAAAAAIASLKDLGVSAVVAILAAGATYYGLGLMFGDSDKSLKKMLGQGAGDSATLIDRLVREGQDTLLRRAIMGGSGMAGLPEDTGTGWGNGIADPLQQIARNTAQTAENTKVQRDLRRYALGGGNLAAIGVTPVELSTHRRGGDAVRVEVKGGGTFESMLSDLVAQVVAKMRTQGAV